MTQSLIKFNTNPSFSRESFFVSDSNREAILWVEKWPDWSTHCLIVYGEKSCGKSHIAHIWQELSGAKLIDLKNFKIETIEKNGCYIVEDIEQKYEVKIFHLYNQVKEKGGYILFTSDKHPSKMNLKLNDVISRLNSVPSCAVHQPDDNLIRTILVKQFSDRQLRINKDVIDYILPRLDRSFFGINKFVEDVDKFSLEEKRNITIPFVSSVIKKLR